MLQLKYIYCHIPVSDLDVFPLSLQHHFVAELQVSQNKLHVHRYTPTHTHTRLRALFHWLPRWAGTRKVKPIWILLKQETMSGSGISWAICKSASCSSQITTPAPHHSVFYRPDALPAAQPTVSEHWRHYMYMYIDTIKIIYKLDLSCWLFTVISRKVFIRLQYMSRSNGI